jgi:hypothetical protein
VRTVLLIGSLTRWGGEASGLLCEQQQLHCRSRHLCHGGKQIGMMQSVDWIVRLLTQASVLIPLLMFPMATGLGAKTHIKLHSS